MLPTPELETETQAIQEPDLSVLPIFFHWDKLSDSRREQLPPAILELPDFVLPKGVTLIMGDNGTGKTTLLYALERALDENMAAASSDTSMLQVALAHHLAKVIEVPDLYIPLVKSMVQGKARPYWHLSARQARDADWVSFTREIKQELLDDGFTPDQLVFLVDEPETGMSPKRHLQIVEEVKKWLEFVDRVVIATNSPILLESDFPRIDLDTPEKGLIFPEEERRKAQIQAKIRMLFE